MGPHRMVEKECEICKADLEPISADYWSSNRFVCREHEREVRERAMYHNIVYVADKAEGGS